MASAQGATRVPSDTQQVGAKLTDVGPFKREDLSTYLTRVKKDIAFFLADPPTGIFIAPYEKDIANIHALVMGPSGTPYEDGFFEFLIRCPVEYPMKPPIVEFLTTDSGRQAQPKPARSKHKPQSQQTGSQVTATRSEAPSVGKATAGTSFSLDPAVASSEGKTLRNNTETEIQRKAAIIIASPDGAVTCRQVLDKAKATVSTNDKRGSVAVVKGHSFREAVAGGDRSTPALAPRPPMSAGCHRKDPISYDSAGSSCRLEGHSSNQCLQALAVENPGGVMTGNAARGNSG
nr:uncharacterized protein LOC119173627 [Rhipicephalus microplus]